MGPMLKHQTAVEDNQQKLFTHNMKLNYNMNTYTYHILGRDAKLSF